MENPAGKCPWITKGNERYLKVHVGDGNASRNRAYPQISEPVGVFIPFFQQVERRCRIVIKGDRRHISAGAAGISKLADRAQGVGIQLRLIEDIDVLYLKAA